MGLATLVATTSQGGSSVIPYNKLVRTFFFGVLILCIDLLLPFVLDLIYLLLFAGLIQLCWFLAHVTSSLVPSNPGYLPIYFLVVLLYMVRVALSLPSFHRTEEQREGDALSMVTPSSPISALSSGTSSISPPEGETHS